MADIFADKSVKPMLIGESRPAFDDPDYIFELKLDGERGIVYLDKGGVALRNKRDLSMLPKFPELSSLHRQVKKRCILDGEFVVAIDGKPDFDEVKRRSIMSDPFKIKLAAAKQPVSFVAYDILYLEDEPLLTKPLLERKRLLLKNVKENESLAVSRWIDEKGVSLFELTKQQGLEGVVAKHKESLYYPGKRTNQWVKCKNMQDDDFIICGYIEKTESVTSLVLGQYSRKAGTGGSSTTEGGIADSGEAEMVYKGHVTFGVNKKEFEIIRQTPRARTHPFPQLPRGSSNEDAIWLAPVNVCTVEYMDVTEYGSLRHATCKGLRFDKTPGECVVKVE